MNNRTACVERKTTETEISIELNLDGTGLSTIETGVGFFDHMLTHVARHGLFDLRVKCVGDLQIDAHHTVEDVGICLGQAFAKAIGDKRGINRYGSGLVPMDESLVQVALDISGRPFLASNLMLPPAIIGTMSAELVDEFLRAFSLHAGLTLHVNKMAGTNLHHIAEAAFKALGRALADAVQMRAGETGLPSTKGAL